MKRLSRHKRYCLYIIMLFALPVFSQTISYQPGGGIQFYSPEENWKFRLLGYIQSTHTFHSTTENETVGNDFFVRRARLDVIFDYRDRYQIFFELDGRGSRTELVLAQFDVRYFRQHKLQIGKFITPFSPENLRSSRSLTTVERYSALNSMFLLPALDTQYGVMFHGKGASIDYYLSITNGNGKASDNLRENNDAKDIQASLKYHPGKAFSIGGSLNFSEEREQPLRLVDHTFNSFNEAQISGQRLGYLLELAYDLNPLLLRSEGFQFQYDEPLSTEQQVGKFRGGYLEAGYFLSGNTSDGFQLLGRIETAEYGDLHPSLAGPTRLTSYLLGNNFYRDGIFRLQVNLIYEQANRPSQLAGTRFSGKEDAFEILTMVQMKF